MIQRILDRAKKVWRRTPLGRTRKSDNPIRWGVIGLGYMAETFSCAIDGNKNGVVYAVASRSLDKAKKFASYHGNCKAYGSYEDMVNDKGLNLDVVYIATPVKYHYEHVKLCLESGLNVLCEKPITSTLEQFKELVAIAKKNDCFFMEGIWMKCLPTFQKACQWVNDGNIGRTELVKVDFYKRENIREGYVIYNAKEGGGVLRDFGIYAIAFMEHFIGGMPESLNGNCRMSSFEIDADWNITAEKNGVNAVVNLSSNFGSLSKAAIIGSDGFIEFESQFNRTNHVTLYDSKGQQVEDYSIPYTYGGFEYEVDEVQKSIRDGKLESRIATLVETHNTMQIIDQLEKYK